MVTTVAFRLEGRDRNHYDPKDPMSSGWRFIANPGVHQPTEERALVEARDVLVRARRTNPDWEYRLVRTVSFSYQASEDITSGSA